MHHKLIPVRFTPLQTYKVLKQSETSPSSVCSFTPLQTYKVLKQEKLQKYYKSRFTPLQTYKVLKPIETPK